MQYFSLATAIPPIHDIDFWFNCILCRVLCKRFHYFQMSVGNIKIRPMQKQSKLRRCHYLLFIFQSGWNIRVDCDINQCGCSVQTDVKEAMAPFSCHLHCRVCQVCSICVYVMAIFWVEWMHLQYTRICNLGAPKNEHTTSMNAIDSDMDNRFSVAQFHLRTPANQPQHFFEMELDLNP